MQIESLSMEFKECFESEMDKYFDPETTSWRPFESFPQQRPRPSYKFHAANVVMFNNETESELFMNCMADLHNQKPGYTDMVNICYALAVRSEGY